MTLTCKIIAVHHGSQFSDGLPRVTLHFLQADAMAKDIRILGFLIPDNTELGDEFTVTFSPKTNQKVAGDYAKGSGV